MAYNRKRYFFYSKTMTKDILYQRSGKLSIQMKTNTFSGSIIVAIVILFLLNPLAGILTAALCACSYKNDNSIKLLMVLAMMYLCAMNTTKIPENDMYRYLAMFENVPYNGFYGTLISFNHSAAAVKDAAYGTLVYLLYYITLGNQYLFIFIVSFLGYWFMFMAIFKFGKESKLPNYMIVTQVLILSFFTQYFSMTFHLVRQVLAACIFIYALTFRNTSFARYILWCIVAIATHSSIVLIVAFSFVPMMKRRLKMVEIVYLALFAAFSVIIISSFAEFLLDTIELEGSMEYTLNRAANMEGAEDSTGAIKFVGFVLTIITIILFYIEWKRSDKMLYPLVVNLALVIALMTLGLSDSPLLQKRFFFYIYSLLPFIYLILVRRVKDFAKPLCFMTVAFLLYYFYATYDKVFEYVPVEEALLNPYPLLIKLI